MLFFILSTLLKCRFLKIYFLFSHRSFHNRTFVKPIKTTLYNKNVAKRGSIPLFLLNRLADSSLICPGAALGLMEAISSFSRKDALKTRPRFAKIYGCHFLNCSPAQLIFHARPSIVSHSHFSHSSRSKDSRSCLGPLPVTRLAFSVPNSSLLRMATNGSWSDTLSAWNEEVLEGNGMFTCNFL